MPSRGTGRKSKKRVKIDVKRSICLSAESAIKTLESKKVQPDFALKSAAGGQVLGFKTYCNGILATSIPGSEDGITFSWYEPPLFGLDTTPMEKGVEYAVSAETLAYTLLQKGVKPDRTVTIRRGRGKYEADIFELPRGGILLKCEKPVLNGEHSCWIEGSSD